MIHQPEDLARNLLKFAETLLQPAGIATGRRHPAPLMGEPAPSGGALRPLPLVVQNLEALLRRHDHPFVRYSEPFKNGEQLLAECSKRGLEGIVSRRKTRAF